VDVEFEHKIKHVEPLSVEVERGQRGGYGWTIKYYGSLDDEVTEMVYSVDQRLRKLFLVKGEEAKDEAKS